MLRTRTIFNDIDQLVKLYNHFSFQSNALRKVIIFGNVIQHLVPRGDFAFDFEGGFVTEQSSHTVVQSTSTVFSSQKMTNQSLQVFQPDFFYD